MKVGLGQDAGRFFPFISLNLDLAIFHRAPSAASALHRLGQLFFFGQTDADKVFNHRHRLAAPAGFDPENIHPAAMFPGRLCRRAGDRWVVWCWRQAFAGQAGKGSLNETRFAVSWNAFGICHKNELVSCRVPSWLYRLIMASMETDQGIFMGFYEMKAKFLNCPGCPRHMGHSPRHHDIVGLG